MQVAATLFGLALSILVCLSVAWLVGRNLSVPGSKPLFVAVVAELWWLLTYAGELISGRLWLTVTFARLQWFGAVVIPVAWTMFVVEYTGRGEYLTRARIAGLSVVPVVTAVASLVAFDGRIWRNMTVNDYDGVTVLTGDMAPLALLFVVFTGLVVTASAILLIEFVLERGTLYTKRALALIGAGTIPIIASSVDTAGLAGSEAFQLTPMTFALSSGLAALAIVEFDMFRSAPVPSHLAAETAVEAVDDPTFVLDSGGVVVDCNGAAVGLVGVDRATLLGTAAGEVTALSDITEGGAGSTLTVETDGGTDYYDVQRTPIDGDGDHTFGSVVTLRDVTDRRERKQRLDALTDVLRATIQEEMATVQRAVDDGDEEVTDIDIVREHAATALGVSDRAGKLASMVEPEAERPADIVPIIHEEIDAAREWRPGVSFVLDATLGEWAYCSGLFEPVFRVSLRHAAERSLQDGADPVVGISVNAGPTAVTVSVSDSGRPLTDHERAVLRGEAQPRPSDQADMSRWLVNWGIEQADGTIRIGTDGEHTSLELTFPRTDASDGQAASDP